MFVLVKYYMWNDVYTCTSFVCTCPCPLLPPPPPPHHTHTRMYAQTQHVCVFRKCYIVLLLVIFSPVGHKRVSHKDPFQPHRRVHSLDAGTAQHDLFSHWPEGNKQRWPTNCRPLCLVTGVTQATVNIFLKCVCALVCVCSAVYLCVFACWRVFQRFTVCIVICQYLSKVTHMSCPVPLVLPE